MVIVPETCSPREISERAAKNKHVCEIKFSDFINSISPTAISDRFRFSWISISAEDGKNRKAITKNHEIIVLSLLFSLHSARGKKTLSEAWMESSLLKQFSGLSEAWKMNVVIGMQLRMISEE